MEPTATTDETTVLQQLSALWPTLTAKQRQLLSEHIVIRTYEKHEIIHMEEDNASQLYYLLDGKVKIYKEGVGGRSQIVRMAKPQGFFGYRAGFADDVYSTSASAFETTTLGIIPVSVMKDIIKENNDVAVYFLRQLAILLRHADEQTVNLTQKHIRGRLAESLLHLKEQYGTDVNTAVRT